MAEDTITKRLILSGLTPAITVADINRRLGSFGSVKAMDGFGLLDSLGQPRKFGYVTLETTPSSLRKCMNVLSGSVWKGTKLRLGEAKPDYKERIARENQEAIEKPPKKRRRFDAVHAADMSLVTAENAAQRPGWQVSSLGRITHPLKTRPLRPLTCLSDQKTRLKTSLKRSLARKALDKKWRKDPDTRTRRTIDMTKWGSTHLKGNFLDSVSLPLSVGKTADIAEGKNYSSDEDAAHFSTVNDDMTADSVDELPRNDIPPQLVIAQGHSDSELLTQPDLLDMEREKAQTLNFLSSLFDDSRDDWIGRESVGSDVEMGEVRKEDLLHAGDEPTFEEVPRTPDQPRSTAQNVGLNGSPSKSQSAAVDLPTSNITSAAGSTMTKLKDLFAPREEAAFSLLDHLDLDVAMDDDIPFLDQPITTESVAPYEPPQNSEVQLTHRTSHIQSLPRIVLNPKQALFFPLPPLESNESNKARQRDPYDLIRENGWYWRDPMVRFWNTESEEEIRKKWEASRGELTKSWKQRWREASKVRRRKKLVDGDEPI